MASTVEDRIVAELLPVDSNWQDSALCPQTDPDAFFPKKGGSAKAAKKICAHCPVSLQCRTFAVENDIHEGIWGGMTLRERRQWAEESGIEWGTGGEPVWLPVRTVADPAPIAPRRLAG